MQSQAGPTKRMVADRKFWRIGKWVCFTFMWLGAIGVFTQMVAEKMYGVHIVSLAAAGALLGIGMVVGAIARAVDNIIPLYENAERSHD
jgi:hypothetical protein